MSLLRRLRIIGRQTVYPSRRVKRRVARRSLSASGCITPETLLKHWGWIWIVEGWPWEQDQIARFWNFDKRITSLLFNIAIDMNIRLTEFLRFVRRPALCLLLYISCVILGSNVRQRPPNLYPHFTLLKI